MASKRKLLPVCIVCGKVPPKGINDGVVVTGNFLCQYCEKELTCLPQSDTRYTYFVGKLKKLWL
ncbi:sigma factor G inhibitor Gin [Zhaonella formicivorans]|jgi:hypothetical protein|uniref:sigma factor G inhibitor Gin n=1 Tax=Zhaonella formicivorans TaxID=2528593 RepID=UPI001D113773